MKYSDVKKYGLTAKGKRELLKYLEGEKLTRKEAMLAKCYECLNGYADGKVDCAIESCPLYPYMPFSACKNTSGRKLTPEQRAKIAERLTQARKQRKKNKVA